MGNGFDEPYLNGRNGWDRGFFRMMRYVGVIGAAVWYMFRWEAKTTTLQSDVDSLRVEVRTLARAVVSERDFVRVLESANEEHRRIWRAIGRADDLRTIR